MRKQSPTLRQNQVVVSAQLTLIVYDGGRQAPSARASFRLCTRSHAHRLPAAAQSGWTLRASAASADPRQDHLPSGPSPTLSTGCQISPAPYLGSNQSGSLLSTCSKPGTTTRPERVHMSLTARISSLRPDPMAKRRVQQCLGSDKNTYD